MATGRVRPANAGAGIVSHLLAAIDATSVGRRVAERSRVLAEKAGARLSLLHVIEPVDEVFLSGPPAELLARHRRSVIEGLHRWVQDRSDLDVQLHVMRARNAASGIIRASRSLGADLVAMGTASEGLGCGPVTVRVARKGWVPVLAIRRQARAPYRHVLAAVDGSPESRGAIELAKTLAPGAQITAVFALDPRYDLMLEEAGLSMETLSGLVRDQVRAAEAMLRDFVAPYGGEVRTLVVEGPPTEVLIETARTKRTDLITIGSRGASGTAMVLLGHAAEGVLQAAPCDVAVARAPGAFRRP